MKNNRLLSGTVRVLTGKYGVFLLTLAHMCLALLVVTIGRKWMYMDISAIQSDYMTMYLLDYRVGFVSRALIGSILYLFTDHPTVRMVGTLFISAVLLSMLLISFLQAKLVKKALLTPDGTSLSALFVSCLHFLNIALWSGGTENIGLLDDFMIDLMLLYFICTMRTERLRFWLAPVVCFIGLLIHTAFFFACVPVICAILWFDMLSQKADRMKIALFCVTCVVSVVLFVLFVFFPRELVRVDSDTLDAMIRQKYDGPIWEDYFGSYLYMNSSADAFNAQSAGEIIGFFHSHSRFFTTMRIRYIRYIAPVIALFAWGCIYGARKKGVRLAACLGFLAPLLALFPEFYVSSDDTRFFSMYLIGQYMMLHYLYVQADAFALPALIPALKKKLTPYAQKRRDKRIMYLRIAFAALTAVYLICGMVLL